MLGFFKFHTSFTARWMDIVAAALKNLIIILGIARHLCLFTINQIPHPKADYQETFIDVFLRPRTHIYQFRAKPSFLSPSPRCNLSPSPHGQWGMTIQCRLPPPYSSAQHHAPLIQHQGELLVQVQQASTDLRNDAGSMCVCVSVFSDLLSEQGRFRRHFCHVCCVLYVFLYSLFPSQQSVLQG